MEDKTSPWAGIAPAAAGAATGIISMLGQRQREKRALKNQEKLMGVQFANQQALNQQGHDLQLQMWKQTNYPAQMEMLKEAGLNPALLYGQSGGGGTTAGSQGGGSAASGNAPAPQPMELGQMLQGAMMQAQVKLMEAQAEKAKAEASNIKGGEGTVGASVIESNLASALNQRTQADINKLGLEIGNATKEDQIDKVHFEVEQIIKHNNLTEQQTEKAKAEVLGIGVKMQLDKANIQVSNEQAKKIANDIVLGWNELDAKLQELGIQNQGNQLRALEGKTRVSALQQDFILGVLGKEIDLHKLNLEQQKIFTNLFNSVLISSAIAKPNPEIAKPVKGFKN